MAPTVLRGEMGACRLANPETCRHILLRIPMGRVAEPGDGVGVVVYFCGPGAAFVTGQVPVLDGGLTATQ